MKLKVAFKPCYRQIKALFYLCGKDLKLMSALTKNKFVKTN